MSNTSISQQPPPPRPPQQQQQQQQQPQQQQQQQQVQQSGISVPSSVAPAVTVQPAVQQPPQDQQSLQNTVVTAIPLVTSSVTTQNVRTFTDLSGETTVSVDPIIGQSGLELSTIDPSSHHQLLGHMPLVATSSGHMGHMPSAPEAHHAMTVGQPTHQSAAVISQLIHPNSYITGLSNGMSMPPHLSHAHPHHYQM